MHISGQNFTEAEIVADMYAAVLEKAGYTPDVKLVDTRDVYMKDFPKNVDVVPEYTGGIVDFLNAHRNGAERRADHDVRPPRRSPRPKPLLDEAGITLLDPSEATDANAFFVTKDYAEQNNLTKLSDLEGKSVCWPPPPTARAVSTARAASTATTASTSPRSCRWATPARRPTSRCSTVSPSSARPAPPTARSRARAWCCSRTTRQIQPAQNLVPVVSRTSSRPTRTWRTR